MLFYNKLKLKLMKDRNHLYRENFSDLCRLIDKQSKGKNSNTTNSKFLSEKELIEIIENKQETLTEIQRRNIKIYVKNNNLQNTIKILW